MNTTSLITNHTDGEGLVSHNARITAEGAKILKKFSYATGIIAAAAGCTFPLDLASKTETDETLASHFQQFSKVEIEIIESLMKVGKNRIKRVGL